MLAEMLAAGLNANLGGRDHAPIEVERQMVRWMQRIFGFPESASGLFVTGTSMANLIGVLIARDAELGFEVRCGGVAGSPKRLARTLRWRRMAASPRRSTSPASAATRCAPSPRTRAIASPSRRCGRRSARTGARAARRSWWWGRPARWTPAPSTTSTRWPVCRDERLWFHVDGACGALAMLAPDLAPRLAGIERADSLAFDFHKWGQVPYDAGFILVRDGVLHRNTFATSAPYLRRELRGLAAGAPWPCDYGPTFRADFAR
jgi:aromatic-L-amino-acid/L-tryptophan decarboxylase